MFALSDLKRDRGRCAYTPDPCTTLTLARNTTIITTIVLLSPMACEKRLVWALVHCQTAGEMAPNPKLLRDDWLATDRIRTSGHQHSV